MGPTAMTTDRVSEVVPRRYLEAYLLLALRRDGRSHGYQLSESVKSLGLSVDLAGVYRALRSMDRRELVSASWTPSDNGPDRREYVLTDAGHDAADTAGEELARLRDALSDALGAFGLDVLERSP